MRGPPWEEVPAPDRSARTIASSPVLRANRIVGQVLARGDLADAAAYLTGLRADRSLRAVTGHIGKVRTDQIHITKDLPPTPVDYQRIDIKPWSDHDAVVAYGWRNPRTVIGLVMGASERFSQVVHGPDDCLVVLMDGCHSAGDLREDHFFESGKIRRECDELTGDDRQRVVIHLGTDAAQICLLKAGGCAHPLLELVRPHNRDLPV